MKNRMQYIKLQRTINQRSYQPRYSFNSSDSSNVVVKEKGSKAQPANSANLEKDSTQANLRECNMALVPSIMTKMAIAK